jgi:hypothetical protein
VLELIKSSRLSPDAYTFTARMRLSPRQKEILKRMNF